MFYTLYISCVLRGQRLVLCDQWEGKQANTVTWTSIVCGKQQTRVFTGEYLPPIIKPSNI